MNGFSLFFTFFSVCKSHTNIAILTSFFIGWKCWTNVMYTQAQKQIMNCYGCCSKQSICAILNSTCLIGCKKHVTSIYPLYELFPLLLYSFQFSLLPLSICCSYCKICYFGSHSSQQDCSMFSALRKKNKRGCVQKSRTVSKIGNNCE